MAMLFDEIINEHYDPREYPALAYLSEQWKGTRPFDGMRILAATPIFRNTLVQYRALMMGGAELVVGRAVGNAGASMPCDPSVVSMLKENGILVISDEDVKSGKVEDDFDLILDCAGQFSFCHPAIGFVELTRSGVQFYENSEFPVYVADSGIVKRIETTLGTGDGCFRALEQLGFGSKEGFKGKKLLVFGSGKVGCGIALQGLRRGLDVEVVTKLNAGTASSSDFVAVIENNDIPVTDWDNTEKVCEQIHSADFVVTATGIKNALMNDAITQALLDSKAILGNMGVEDEFGSAVPESRVLNRKSTLNFILEEPTHLKYIDTSLALHAALGARLVLAAGDIFSADPSMADSSDSAVEPLQVGPQNPPSELEQELLMVTIQNGVVGPEVCEMLGITA